MIPRGQHCRTPARASRFSLCTRYVMGVAGQHGGQLLYVQCPSWLPPASHTRSPAHTWPLQMRPQDKVVIGKVAGVNAPELETLIMDNVPPASADE
jgi:hypothetical protein